MTYTLHNNEESCASCKEPLINEGVKAKLVTACANTFQDRTA